MQKHYIIKKNVRQDGRGKPSSVATNNDNNCYPTLDAAVRKASKLAENATAPQLIIYEAVKVVEQERPKVTVEDIEAPWHDKDTECEDTECRRCFPTHD